MTAVMNTPMRRTPASIPLAILSSSTAVNRCSATRVQMIPKIFEQKKTILLNLVLSMELRLNNLVAYFNWHKKSYTERGMYLSGEIAQMVRLLRTPAIPGSNPVSSSMLKHAWPTIMNRVGSRTLIVTLLQCVKL